MAFIAHLGDQQGDTLEANGLSVTVGYNPRA